MGKMEETTLDEALSLVKEDVDALRATEPVVLGLANPPNSHGVYVFMWANEVVYVGEAKGSKGLRDRFNKHISGDDGHALQNAFASEFPDRSERRNHIKKIHVRWWTIEDPHRISAVERILIWLYRPKYNRK